MVSVLYRGSRISRSSARRTPRNRRNPLPRRRRRRRPALLPPLRKLPPAPPTIPLPIFISSRTCAIATRAPPFAPDTILTTVGAAGGVVVFITRFPSPSTKMASSARFRWPAIASSGLRVGGADEAAAITSIVGGRLWTRRDFGNAPLPPLMTPQFLRSNEPSTIRRDKKRR